jgi:hypothetical protein
MEGVMNIVFTGPAFDGAGFSIVRGDLIAACATSGHAVQRAVKPDTDLLVASRTDTVKAKAALLRGVEVMTYPTFLAKVLGSVAIARGARPDKYTDVVDKSLLVPDFTVGFEALDAA